MRIPKLRGFKNRLQVEYEIVNVGAIDALVGPRRVRAAEAPEEGRQGARPPQAQITVNQDILRAVGLVRTLDKPLKILGAGDLTVPLFVVADAFTASARAKIEAAGGVVNVLEVPTTAAAALGREPKAPPAGDARARGEGRRRREPRHEAVEADATPAEAAEPKADAAEPEPPRPRRPPRARAEGRGEGRQAAERSRADGRGRGERGRRRGDRAAEPEPRPRRGTVRRPTPDPVFDSLLNAFRAPDIRRRILYVLGLLIVFRLLASVPVPGIDKAAAASSSSRATRSSGCSTCSRAADWRRSRSSRWG